MKTPRANGAVRVGRNAQDALFVLLDGGDHPPSTVGGKAAALDRLVRTGFRVPPAAAMTSDAYRTFVRSSGLDAWLARFARRRPGGAERAEAERREVEAAFLDAPLPGEVRAAIAAAWRSVSADGPVAVRSSATAEDMAASSFAGQYLSVLEVEGLEAVEIAVKRVWASLWEVGARAYRRRMRVSDRRLAMGVVIQRMVPALRSGVCFTVDPTMPDAVRVEMVDGLGEDLVSGAATPTVFQLKKPSLVPVSGERHPEARSIARAALRIQEELGVPQDVEWSIADDGLWILQARPITTLGGRTKERSGDGFDTAPAPGAIYSPTGVGEMLPGVLAPLLWTINAPMVEDGFRRLFADLDALPESLDGAYSVVARIDGQAALNISVIKESATRLSGGNGDDIERQYLGRVVSDPSANLQRKPGFVRRATSSLRAMKLQKKVEAKGSNFERAVHSVTQLDLDPREMLTPELVAYRARVRDLAANGVATEVALATIAVTTYAALREMLERWTGAGESWAQRLTRGSISRDPVTTAATNAWAAFHDSPAAEAIAAAVTGGEPGTVEDRLAAVGPEGDAFARSLREELDRLGSSALYAGPTWTEQRGYVWAVVMRWMAEPPGDDEDIAQQARRDLSVLETTVMRSWRWRIKRVVTGQVIDLRRRMLHEMVDDAQRLLHRRESVKAALLALGGVERRLILELADRLVRRGRLTSARDVQLLADWELDDLALGRTSVDEDVIERRRGALLTYTSGPALTPLVNDEVLREVPSLERIAGWAASPGKHRGRVRVVRDLTQAAELASGDVLVASATDPSWTPLFMIAGAIVVERGGPLSHAAIVSRELGVPAVLNAPNATSLPDGALVEVDGTSGTVTILEGNAVIEETVS